MKKLILFGVLLLSCYAGFSQTPSGYTNIRARYNWIAGKFDSGWHMPVYNTMPHNRVGVADYPGNVGLDSVLSQPWYYSDSTWRRFGTVYNITLGFGLAGTNPLTTSGTIRADSNALFTNLFNTLALTTAGSGAATWNSTTRILNIPTPSLSTYYNSNVGTGFRWVIPNTNNVKTAGVVYPIQADSATSNVITFSLDTATGKWRSENYYNTVYTPLTRSITINGVTQDFSANRTWNVGTVTSVGLSLPSEFNVTNSPVTSSGTLTGGWANQSAFTVFRRGSGTGVPSFGTIDTTYIASFWEKVRSLFSVTTTGSGAASYVNGVINIPTPTLPTYYNSNIGSGYRLAVPNTNNIKTLFGAGIITIDSVSNSNALTITATEVDGSNSNELQTWQETLTTGSVLTGNNDVTGSGYNFTITNPGSTTLIGNDRMYYIANGGNLLDVDFDDGNNSITVLLEDPQIGLQVDGGTNASILTGQRVELGDVLGGFDGGQIYIRDSIQLLPRLGVLNIDSLRSWTSISDSSYKRIMTWDERNGRVEYFDAYFPSNESGLQTVTSQNNSGDFQVSLNPDAGGYFKISPGTGIGINIDLSGGAGAGVATISATDPSTTNELQTIANTSDATSHTATLSSSGGSTKYIEGPGISLSTGGTSLDGTLTIANTGLIDFSDDNGFDGSVTSNVLSLTTTLDEGSVFFALSGGALGEDNANFFYDNTNDFLGLGTNSPDVRFDVLGSFSDEYLAEFNNTNGDGQGIYVEVGSNDGSLNIANFVSAGGSMVRFISNGAVMFNGDAGSSGEWLKSIGGGGSPVWDALPDNSATNEIQTFSTTSATDEVTVTLSSGGSIKLIGENGVNITVGGTSLNPIITISAHTH